MLKRIKNQKACLGNSRGFTLLELLVVIGVIGIITVAVLATLNPVEQIRRARDTRRSADATELLNAIERYYAANDAAWPWTTNPTGSCPQFTGAPTGYDCLVTAQTPVNMQLLISSNELKASFANRNVNEYYVTLDVPTQTVRVCYDPEAQVNNARATFNITGGTTAPTGYICIPA